MSSNVWGILAPLNGQYQALRECGTKFTTDVQEAKTFETEEAARVYASQLKTPTIVQILVGVTRQPEIHIPHPDFYEAGNEYMELADLIKQISSEDLVQYFTPVQKITGGGQMTGSSIICPIRGNVLGREFVFSFSRLLKDNDMESLRNALSLNKDYAAAGYQIHRLGFTAYATLILRTERK